MAGSKTLGNDLREARLKAGLSQVKFATQLQVDPAAISGWERGIRMPDEKNREAVAAFLGLSLADYLVKYVATGRQDGPPAPQEEAAGARVRRQAAGERLRGESLLTDEDRALLQRLLQQLEGTG